MYGKPFRPGNKVLFVPTEVSEGNMGKFDRYSAGPPLLSGQSSGPLVESRLGKELARAEQAARTSSATAEELIAGKPARIVVALDATGSMSSLLDAAKASIREIVTRASREAGCLIEFELLAYRDYDVAQRVLERSGMTADGEQLFGWLSRVYPDGGGANDGEAIEVALQAIVDDGAVSTVLLAGDEPSNSAASRASAGRSSAPGAHELATRLGQTKVPVHTFVVGSDPRAISDFAEIARLSGGKSGRLDGSREMIDLAVLAILSALRGAGVVRRYMEATRLSANAEQFGQLLVGPR